MGSIGVLPPRLHATMRIAAADLLHDKVLPFYEAVGVPVGAVLTITVASSAAPRTAPLRATPHGGGHPDRTTKVRSPRTNGFVERMNRTSFYECFRIGGRTNWYATPEERQTDLDTFVVFYNFARSYQGYRVAGRTPAEALVDGIGPRSPCPAEALMAS